MGLRHLIYRTKYRFAKDLELKIPVDVSLELVAGCNQSCSYCYFADRPNLPFKQGVMTDKLAGKIITESSEIGVNSIKLNYRGESTLHPKFHDIAWLAKSKAHGSSLMDRITNSNFKFNINRDDIFNGLSYQTKVKVSFDSFLPGVMEKQRAGSDTKVALANINKFYNWPKRKTKIVIQAVRTQLNANEDIASEVNRRWPEATCNINDMVGGRVNKDLTGLAVKERDPNNRKSCIQAHARLIVNWDGKVQACCPDIGSKLLLGNMNHSSLVEIWNGEPAKELRQSLLDKSAFNLDPCKTCSSHESYGSYKPKWES